MWNINNALKCSTVYFYLSYGNLFSEIIFLKSSYCKPTSIPHVLILGYSVATGKLSLPTYIVLGAPGFGNKNGNIGAVST